MSERIWGHVRALLANEDGASIVFIGLTLPGLIAAITAATNAGSNYVAEAKAVTTQYGFQDGVGQVTVAVNKPATAPGCASNCYTVTITDQVPLYLSQVIGYQGSAGANNQRVTTLNAGAVATSTTAYAYCVLALASSGKQGSPPTERRTPI